jgi:hypothetical protein
MLPQQDKDTRQKSAKEEKYYQLHLHGGKVTLAAMYLRRVGELAVAWRPRRMF